MSWWCPPRLPEHLNSIHGIALSSTAVLILSAGCVTSQALLFVFTTFYLFPYCQQCQR